MSTEIIYSLLAEDGITGILTRWAGMVDSLIGGSVKLAAQYEQTQIGFTSMLRRQQAGRR